MSCPSMVAMTLSLSLDDICRVVGATIGTIVHDPDGNLKVKRSEGQEALPRED